MAEALNRGVKEPIIFGILTLLWWLCSLTILLPFVLLLKYSPAFRKRWFTWLRSKVESMDVKIIPIRKECFQMLEEKLNRWNKTESLKVLEIGIGSGANFSYYPENSSLIAVDMNPNFDEPLRENLKNFPEIKVEKIIYSMAEDMSEVAENSVDIVISTHVLCSVDDARSALDEVRRVLKPGGLFLFMEHIALSDHRLSLTVQNFATPLWSLYFAGCCLNRETRSNIEQTGFTEIDCRMMEAKNLPAIVRLHVIGVAVK